MQKETARELDRIIEAAAAGLFAAHDWPVRRRSYEGSSPEPGDASIVASIGFSGDTLCGALALGGTATAFAASLPARGRARGRPRAGQGAAPGLGRGAVQSAPRADQEQARLLRGRRADQRANHRDGAGSAPGERPRGEAAVRLRGSGRRRVGSARRARAPRARPRRGRGAERGHGRRRFRDVLSDFPGLGRGVRQRDALSWCRARLLPRLRDAVRRSETGVLAAGSQLAQLVDHAVAQNGGGDPDVLTRCRAPPSGP